MIFYHENSFLIFKFSISYVKLILNTCKERDYEIMRSIEILNNFFNGKIVLNKSSKINYFYKIDKKFNREQSIEIFINNLKIAIFVEGINVTKYKKFDENKVYETIEVHPFTVCNFFVNILNYILQKSLLYDKDNNSKEFVDFYLEGTFISPIFRIKLVDKNKIYLRIIPDKPNKNYNTLYGIDYLILDKDTIVENILNIIEGILSNYIIENENYVSDLKLGA